MGKTKKWYFSGKAITAFVLLLIVIGVVIIVFSGYGLKNTG